MRIKCFCAGDGRHRSAGFTLVELMLAMVLGLMLFGVVVRLLMAESAQGVAMAQRLQMRRLQHRALALVKGDLASAAAWQLQPVSDANWRCSMAGRQPVLAITPRHGTSAVVYSVGEAPSAIWRGAVLMRCGPSFDLYGQVSASGHYQNRVVLDGVEQFTVEQDPNLPLLKLQIEQFFDAGFDRRQRLRSSDVG